MANSHICSAQLENSWDTMESKTMPNEDSDT